MQNAVHYLAPIAARRFDRSREHPVTHRVQVLERQLLQVEIKRVQPKAIGDWRVNIQRLAGDPLAMGWRHCIEGPHVVQAVGEFDQDDAYVLRHCEQHLAEVLGLRILARLKLDLVELGDAIDHIGNGLAER